MGRSPLEADAPGSAQLSRGSERQPHRSGPYVGLVGAVLAGLLLATPGGAQVLLGLQQPAGPPPPTPAQEATNVGLGQCAPLIDQMVSDSVNGQTAQTSLWKTENPGQHIFQSVIGISGSGNPPDAMAAVIAAPVTAGSCDGASVRIYPLAVPCDTAQAAVTNGGRFLFNIMNSRVLLDANNERLMLLPGANNTCIAVAVNSYFGQ